MTAGMTTEWNLDTTQRRIQVVEAEVQGLRAWKLQAEDHIRSQRDLMEQQFSEMKGHLRILEYDLRETRAWKLEAEERLQHQVELMAELVKRCVGGDSAEVLEQRELEISQKQSQRPISRARPENGGPVAAAINLALHDEGITDPFMAEHSGPPVRADAVETRRHFLLSPVSLSPKPEPDTVPLPRPRQYPTRSTGKKAPKSKRPNAPTRPYRHFAASAVHPLTSSEPVSPEPSSSAYHAIPSSSTSPGLADSFQGSIDPPTTVKSSTMMVTRPDGTKVPIFYFHKHPETIKEQWDEYAHGLNGQRAVRELDEKYTTKWRASQYARTWYSRRKRVWDLIINLTRDGLSEEEAVAKIDKMKGSGTVAGFVDLLAHQSRRATSTATRGFVAVNPGETTLKDMKRVERKSVPMNGHDEEDEADLEILQVESEEERPRKRRSSLKLRNRMVEPSYAEDLETSSDSDSQGSDHEWE